MLLFLLVRVIPVIPSMGDVLMGLMGLTGEWGVNNDMFMTHVCTAFGITYPNDFFGMEIWGSPFRNELALKVAETEESQVGARTVVDAFLEKGGYFIAPSSIYALEAHEERDTFLHAVSYLFQELALVMAERQSKMFKPEQPLELIGHKLETKWDRLFCVRFLAYALASFDELTPGSTEGSSLQPPPSQFLTSDKSMAKMLGWCFRESAPPKDGFQFVQAYDAFVNMVVTDMPAQWAIAHRLVMMLTHKVSMGR